MRAPLLVACLLLAGCMGTTDDTDTTSRTGTTTTTTAAPTLAVASPAFKEMQPIPRKYSCDENPLTQTSPPLNITSAPAGTVSLALIVQDPDVPTPEAPTRTITHWLVWNLTATNGRVSIQEGRLPDGAVQGQTDFGTRWVGPCPPAGSNPHRYNFTAYALDTAIELPSGSSRASLEAEMQGHVLARARLIGTYQRQIV